MPRKSPAAPLSFVARLDDGNRLEYKGGLTAGIRALFTGLPDALARRKMLDELEKTHRKMLAQEDGPDSEQRDTAPVATLAPAHAPGATCFDPACRVCADPAAANSALPRRVEPDECAAGSEGHSFRKCGPNGELQCQYCGLGADPHEVEP